jgi:hypothetical protein
LGKFLLSVSFVIVVLILLGQLYTALFTLKVFKDSLQTISCPFSQFIQWWASLYTRYINTPTFGNVFDTPRTIKCNFKLFVPSQNIMKLRELFFTKAKINSGRAFTALVSVSLPLLQKANAVKVLKAKMLRKLLDFLQLPCRSHKVSLICEHHVMVGNP